jgi:predicted DNA-binding transcriptional regulator/DNA-binding XRE family transcriptional regulator
MHQKHKRRSVHRQDEYGRLRQKTREHQFVHQLEREFELSPRESRGILEVVQETFLDKEKLQQGQMEYVCVHAEEGAGKTIAEMRKVRVVLTCERADDHEIQERLGESAMRRVQILRMTEEAYDQHGLLTQEDLGRILGVSSRTIRRDVEELMQQNLRYCPEFCV